MLGASSLSMVGAWDDTHSMSCDHSALGQSPGELPGCDTSVFQEGNVSWGGTEACTWNPPRPLGVSSLGCSWFVAFFKRLSLYIAFPSAVSCSTDSLSLAGSRSLQMYSQLVRGTAGWQSWSSQLLPEVRSLQKTTSSTCKVCLKLILELHCWGSKDLTVQHIHYDGVIPVKNTDAEPWTKDPINTRATVACWPELSIYSSCLMEKIKLYVQSHNYYYKSAKMHTKNLPLTQVR